LPNNLQTDATFAEMLPDTGALYAAIMEKYGARVNTHALLGSCWAAGATGWK
jgi:hypothetical protein